MLLYYINILISIDIILIHHHAFNIINTATDIATLIILILLLLSLLLYYCCRFQCCIHFCRYNLYCTVVLIILVAFIAIAYTFLQGARVTAVEIGKIFRNALLSTKNCAVIIF